MSLGLLGPAGTVLGGLEANAEGQARQQELERQAQLTTIAAKQSAAARTEQLQQVIGSVRTLTAQRGLNIDSPSAQAIQDRSTRNSDLNIGRGNFNAAQDANNYSMAGRVARQSGQMQMYGSFLKAGGQVYDEFSSAAAGKG